MTSKTTKTTKTTKTAKIDYKARARKIAIARAQNAKLGLTERARRADVALLRQLAGL